MGTAAKYLEIVGALSDEIATGTYSVGQRVPSENQLSVRFGVSRPTAARALRELEVAGLVERRSGSGTYVRRTGRALPADTMTFGLLVQGLGETEIFDPICTEITRICQDQGLIVLWGEASSPDADGSEVERLCRYYLQRGVDGVFFAPLEHLANREQENLRIANAMRAAGVAVVLLDRDITDFPGRSQFDLVGIDNFLAGFHLTDHLIRLGYKRIRFVARPHHPSTTDLRVAGSSVALERAALEPSSTFHLSGDPSDQAFVADLVQRQRPDAIVCSNDLTAALLVVTLAHLGLQVPNDMAVVGFDDVKYSTFLSVGLTTMRQPYAGIARVAVQAMLDRVRDPDLIPRMLLLDAALVTRQSSGAELQMPPDYDPAPRAAGTSQSGAADLSTTVR